MISDNITKRWTSHRSSEGWMPAKVKERVQSSSGLYTLMIQTYLISWLPSRVSCWSPELYQDCPTLTVFLLVNSIALFLLDDKVPALNQTIKPDDVKLSLWIHGEEPHRISISNHNICLDAAVWKGKWWLDHRCQEVEVEAGRVLQLQLATLIKGRLISNLPSFG